MSRTAFEALVLTAYRERKISAAQLRHLLGYETRMEVDAFLKKHGVELEYTLEELSDVTHRSAKSLMRMLGPRGNPQARNLFEIVAYLQRAEGVHFEVRSAGPALRASRRRGSLRAKRATSAALNR